MSNSDYPDSHVASIDDDRELIRTVVIELLEYVRGRNRDRRDREWYEPFHESDRRLGYPPLKYPGERG